MPLLQHDSTGLRHSLTVDTEMTFSVRSDRPSYKIRDFSPATWCRTAGMAADEPEGRRLLDAAGHGPESVPLVVTPDGRTLAAPTSAEVAVAVGLSTAPVR